MLLAFAQGTKRVDEKAIKEAAQDLDLEFVLADVAGSHPPLDGLEERSLTSDIGLKNTTPTQQPAALESTKSNGRQAAIAKPISDQIPSSTAVRTPVSDGPKPGAQKSAVLQSSVNDGQRQPITKTDLRSSSIRIGEKEKPSDKQKHGEQKLLVVPLSSNRPSEPPVAALRRSSSVSMGRKLFWASLLAAAIGGGVLFGHGLGNIGQQPTEEHLESVSRSPLTPSRKDKGSNVDTDDGPDVVVSSFPQSAPGVSGAAQENTKAIFFDGDSAEVSDSYKSMLQRIAESLTGSPQSNAIIEGHTDTSGEESYNLDLSMRRAVAVRDILVKQYQVAASRLSTVGVGSSRPLESNSTRRGRAYNRRVEMRIMKPDSSLAARSQPE
jgi:outer membrane protein OmpA-like peptidoglycan-associated protein